MKQKDSFYFDNFVECTHYSLQAAKLLQETLASYDPATLKDKLVEMHAIEHAADTKKHEMLAVLMKAFMTPIEREDINLLSSCLDEVTDKIEDVMQRMYINNVETVIPIALDMVNVVIECCSELVKLMDEFRNFKRKSKTLHDSIIRINTLEEDGDRLFLHAMRTLHEEAGDPFKVIKWREIFIYLEKCSDATEHVADVVERVVMTNT